MLHWKLKSVTDYGGLFNPQQWSYLQKHLSEATPALFLLCWSTRTCAASPSLSLCHLVQGTPCGRCGLVKHDRHLQFKQSTLETGTKRRGIKSMWSVALPEQGISPLKARLGTGAWSNLGKWKVHGQHSLGSSSLPLQALTQLLALCFYPHQALTLGFYPHQAITLWFYPLSPTKCWHFHQAAERWLEF